MTVDYLAEQEAEDNRQDDREPEKTPQVDRGVLHGKRDIGLILSVIVSSAMWIGSAYEIATWTINRIVHVGYLRMEVICRQFWPW